MTKKQNAKTGAERKPLDIKVVRAKEFDNGNVGFSMYVNDVAINNCVFIEGSKGDFVSFPSRKNEADGKYYNYAYVKLEKADVSSIREQIESILDS